MLLSTRDEIKTSASKAIIEGLAKDGGLYIFDSFPKVDLNKLIDYSYKDLSVYILSLLLDDYTEDEIKDCVNKAYDNKFDCDELVGFKEIDDATVLELYHGPTLAFKDMALTLLPQLLKKAKEKNNIDKNTIILTATSGDTGGATLSGFSGVDGIKLIVFYPNNLVSSLQERQMLSYRNKDMKVIAYDGNFDDAQSFVKEMFKKYPNLSSSNSINLGRLVPQVVYYFYGYLKMCKKCSIKMGDSINVSVPTGNFGNILACFIAKKMGLPINKLICASNKNKVLTDFFKTGVYDINRVFYKTNSPSMDILISSNLERLLYLLYGKTTRFMEDLKNNKKFSLSKEELIKLNDFYGDYLDEEETLDIINKVYNNYNYLLDTHSAVAYGVYLKYKDSKKDNTKTLVISTASPYKFAPDILKALGKDVKEDAIKELFDYTKTSIPKVILSYQGSEKEFWKKEETKNKFDEALKEYHYE
ncbi:MAG: threonine synthase [Bacilli bacterium]|nr:threonine synthase [Bacilli bacterium]